MIQLKFFETIFEINKFLKEKRDKIEYVDLKFQRNGEYSSYILVYNELEVEYELTEVF